MVGKPRLQSLGGIYQLDFTDAMVSVRVDRINESSKHETTGEITVVSRIPGQSGHLHQARLNLTATRTRKEVANVLTEKVAGVDWSSVMEYVCVMVLEKHREGTPVIKLADHAMPEGLAFRLVPFIQERQATLIFGEGDTGKSWLAILMGIMVSQGISTLGMEAEPGNVLYLDYETDEDTLWERVNMISAGLGIAIPDGIFYRQMHQILSADLQQINKLVVDHDISLVIVDSAAPAVGEPESSTPTTEYFRALRSLRASNLTIAHVAKGGRENEPFGSIFWRNLPRANFRVTASHEPGASQFVVGLKHTKSNNGKRLRDRAFQVSFQEGAVYFSPADIEDIPELSSNVSLSQRISAALRHGALSVSELADQLETSDSSVRGILNRHKEDLFTIAENEGGIIRWGNRYKEGAF